MATYFNDLFDGTADTLLSAHTADLGGGYTRLGAGLMTNALSGDGFVYRNAAGTTSAMYKRTTTMEVADYQVDLTFKVKSLLAADIIVVHGRVVDFSNYYEVDVFQDGAIRLRKSTTAGGLVQLALGAVSLTAGATHKISLLMVGSTITMLFDDAVVTATSGSNPVSDASLAGPGSIGLQVGYATSTAQTTSTGLQADRLMASDPVVPVNSVAPVITTDGTPQTGETVSCSTGTWTPTPTSYAYQWKRDGSNIGGATTSSYQLQLADEGHAIKCTVTATNAVGSGTPTDSDTITPASGLPPGNTVAPAITTDGTPATGETISVSNGTWTGGPTGFAYEWKRGGAAISGATSSTYPLVLADEGESISCTVTATNLNGSTAADSNVIVPATTGPLSDAHVTIRLSGGATNTVATGSHGGTESVIVAGADIFDSFSYLQGLAGFTDWRLLYVHNANSVYSAGLRAYVALQEAAPGHAIAIAAATEAAGATVTATADRFTAPPVEVVFAAPANADEGVDLGTIAPGQKKGLWVQRTISPGTPPSPINPGIISVEVTQL